MPSRSKILAAALGAALVTVGAFAVHAVAITQVQNDDPVVPNSQNTVSVSCPAGQKALGGGTFTNADTTNQVNVIVGSRPADGDDPGTKLDDGWTGVHDTGATPAGGASAIALCQGGKVASELKFRQRQFGIPADSVKTKTVDCPSNYKVTGGGVDASGTFNATEVEGTRPVDGGGAWEGRVRNFHPTDAKSFTVYAVCATGRFASKLVYRVASETADAAMEGFAFLDCSSIGGKATGGGSLVKNDEAALIGSSPIGTSFSSDVWALGPDARFKTYAVCKT
jgi:hypothetical protein